VIAQLLHPDNATGPNALERPLQPTSPPTWGGREGKAGFNVSLRSLLSYPRTKMTDMVVIWGLIAVLFLADAALVWVLRRSHVSHVRRIDELHIEPSPPYDDLPMRAEVEALRKDVASDIEELAGRMKNLTHAVAEGIERVDRSERRVSATIARAQTKLAASGYEDPGVEAEIEGLRLLDGDGIGTGELPTVQSSLDNPGDEPSSIPGISVGQLQRVRGL